MGHVDAFVVVKFENIKIVSIKKAFLGVLKLICVKFLLDYKNLIGG